MESGFRDGHLGLLTDEDDLVPMKTMGMAQWAYNGIAGTEVAAENQKAASSCLRVGERRKENYWFHEIVREGADYINMKMSNRRKLNSDPRAIVSKPERDMLLATPLDIALTALKQLANEGHNVAQEAYAMIRGMGDE